MEPVFVVPYDPRWPSLFALERSRVEAAVGPWVKAVEHVGSTAVPGLDAKLVIDLMVGVREIQGAGRCIRPLEEIGYSYWTENPNPDRMLFVRFADAGRTSRTHNLHVVELGGDLWNDRLVFRDYLRSHPEVAGEYARLKHALAERFRDDREAYTKAKTAFVLAVLERGGPPGRRGAGRIFSGGSNEVYDSFVQRTVIDNRYTLVETLGGGGMAEVYLAHDDVLDREVALKILRNQYANDEEFVERFRREAQSAAKLSHPNIVSIYDRGRSEDGAYYIAMEHVQRGTLKDRIKRDGALAPDVAAGVALQIADALQAAHENGVIHRDIKPQNVLVTRTGDAKVTDFGIARAASSPLTQTSAVLGTAAYMSPEQATGQPVGPQSDLYSLGVVLFEMLTGELPYDAESPISLAMKHVNEPPRSPREANPGVPKPLDAITLKLLAKNPEDRYASAAELADDLERVRSGLPPAASGAEKTTEAMTTPLAPPPATLGERTAKTAVRPPVAPPPRVPGRAGRRGVPSRTLAALFFGLVLLAGLAWALTSLLSGPDESEDQSGAYQDEAPDTEETDTVAVPNLVGVYNVQGAAEALAAEGLLLGEVGEAPSDTIFAGLVSEQNPAAGEEVEPNTSVGVTVSTGPAQAAPAPAPAPQPVAAPLPDPQPDAVQQPDPEAAEEAVEDREEAREERQEARREAKENQKGKGNNKKAKN